MLLNGAYASKFESGWARKKIYYFVELLLLDIALFEYAPHSIVNVNKQLKRGSTRVFFYFDKTTEQVTIIQLDFFA
jgi:hypothetical protein